MDHDGSSIGRIRVGRLANEAENGQWMIGHTVIGPTGVMILPDGAFAHVGPIFLLLDLLEKPKETLVGKDRDQGHPSRLLRAARRSSDAFEAVARFTFHF